MSSIAQYVDGVLQTSTLSSSGSASTIVHTQSAKIGTFEAGTGRHNGFIHDLKLFNSQLTQSEITSIFDKKGQMVRSA